MKIYFLIIIASLTTLLNRATAQTTSGVITKDFMIMPLFNQTDSSVINLSVMVKIYPFTNANILYLSIGTDSANTSNILTTQATINHYSGTDSLTYNAINYPLTNYTAYFPLQLTPQQWANAKRASVYVTNINNIPTSTLYFNIKP